jgi:hypothetical protein
LPICRSPCISCCPLSAFALASGLVYGFAVSRLLHLPPARAGVFATSASFTNLGAIGALVVFMLLENLALPWCHSTRCWKNSGTIPSSFRSHGPMENGQTLQQALEGTLFCGIARKVLRDPFLIVSLLSCEPWNTCHELHGNQQALFYSASIKVLVPQVPHCFCLQSACASASP